MTRECHSTVTLLRHVLQIGLGADRPYAEKTHRREDGAMEFRHSLRDICNELLDMGFSIEQVHEEPHSQRQDPQAQSGSSTH
jgi:hypothetical protein